MSCRFEDAYRKARNRYPEYQWNDLNPRSQSAAIYQEMRRLDAADSLAKGEFPIFADHRRPKVRMRSASDQAEADVLIDVAGRN
jgi:hypothetical protein